MNRGATVKQTIALQYRQNVLSAIGDRTLGLREMGWRECDCLRSGSCDYRGRFWRAVELMTSLFSPSALQSRSTEGRVPAHFSIALKVQMTTTPAAETVAIIAPDGKGVISASLRCRSNNARLQHTLRIVAQRLCYFPSHHRSSSCRKSALS